MKSFESEIDQPDEQLAKVIEIKDKRTEKDFRDLIGDLFRLSPYFKDEIATTNGKIKMLDLVVNKKVAEYKENEAFKNLSEEERKREDEILDILEEFYKELEKEEHNQYILFEYAEKLKKILEVGKIDIGNNTEVDYKIEAPFKRVFG